VENDHASLVGRGLLLAGACGTSAPSLSRAERDRLPRDARQEIFDAENDVIIAHNRQDEAEERIRAHTRGHGPT